MESLTRIDPAKVSSKSAQLEWRLKSKVVGQARAVRQLVKALEKFQHGLQIPNRPLAVLLFAGPTGVGKSELVHALAEVLFSNRNFITRVDCAEFRQEHEISKLIGAPPGYVGYRDGFRNQNAARFSQANLDQFQAQYPKDAPRLNIVLMDEIEKANESIFDILLGILDTGKCTLGNNEKSDMTKTILIMTSNLGSKEVKAHLEGGRYGFHSPMLAPVREKLDRDIYHASKKAIEKFFRPEFINRLDKIVVFHSLSEEHLKNILALEIKKFQSRLFQTLHFTMIRLTPAAESFLLKEGTSELYGARELGRTVERLLSEPIISLIGSGQLEKYEDVHVDVENDALVFDKCLSKIFTKPDSPIDPAPSTPGFGPGLHGPLWPKESLTKPLERGIKSNGDLINL